MLAQVSGYNIGFDVDVTGRAIVSGSCDGRVFIYDRERSSRLHQLKMSDNREVCNNVACHPVLSALTAVTTLSGELSIWK